MRTRSSFVDTALRHGKYFGSTPQFWLNLQMAYDLSRAEAETDLSEVSRRRAC
jgi:antitoxin HigA-1